MKIAIVFSDGSLVTVPMDYFTGDNLDDEVEHSTDDVLEALENGAGFDLDEAVDRVKDDIKAYIAQGKK